MKTHMISLCSSPDGVVWILAQAGNIVLCSWARSEECFSPPKSTNGRQRIEYWGNPAMD